VLEAVAKIKVEIAARSGTLITGPATGSNQLDGIHFAQFRN
jgi:hypothetical protein